MNFIKKGTYRVALILGPVTFKFIRPAYFIIFLKSIFIGIREKNLDSIINEWPLLKRGVIRGLFGNITEFFTWQVTGANFLAPTYFSCALFNIQKTITGESVDCIEIVNKILDALPEYRSKQWLRMEDHLLWQNSGWVKTEKGYVLFDYGDCFASGLPFSNILITDQEELEKILSQ